MTKSTLSLPIKSSLTTKILTLIYILEVFYIYRVSMPTVGNSCWPYQNFSPTNLQVLGVYYSSSKGYFMGLRLGFWRSLGLVIAFGCWSSIGCLILGNLGCTRLIFFMRTYIWFELFFMGLGKLIVGTIVISTVGFDLWGL